MPAIEPNRLQKVYRDIVKEIEPLYLELQTAISEQIGEGFTAAASVDIAYRETDYLNRVQSIINSGQVAASSAGFWSTQFTLNLGLAENYFLFTKFADGVNLAETIHSGESQKAVKAVLKDAFKVNTSAKTVMDDLVKATKGLSVESQKKVINTGINHLVKSFKDAGAKDTVKNLKKLDRYILGLKNDSALRRAYIRLSNAVEAGTQEAINKAVDKAVNQQAKYINERIARTETARAYDMSISRAIHDDPNAIGFRWTLSSGHPVPDICDCYAEVDAYGMGAGIYPAEAGAKIPAHPNCLCLKDVVYRKKGMKKGRYSEKRVNSYLSGLDDKKRGQVIGVNNSQNKDYAKGLTDRGFNPKDSNIRMVSKSIIKRRDTE